MALETLELQRHRFLGAPARGASGFEKTLHYQATLTDPKTWTRPSTVALPLTQHPEYQMFEYACHEGIYAVPNILSGERAAEQAASEGSTR